MNASPRWLSVCAVAVALAAPLAVVAPATASTTAALPAATAPPTPSFQPDQGGFHSVLGYGSGQTTSAVDLALFEAVKKTPPTLTNQASLYNAVIAGRPHDDGDLSRYYKDSSFARLTGADIGSAEQPIAGATVIRDKKFNVPHIYASTRAAGMYAAGYTVAKDRLFLMDVLRRTAEGQLAGLLGADSIADDSAQLGQFDLSPAEMTREVNAVAKSEGRLGRQALADIKQYVAGINGYISAALANPTMLPAEYVALGATPRAWTLADTVAEAYLLIARFTVAGDGEQFQSDILSRLERRLGRHQGQRVFDDLRLANDPDAMTTTKRRFTSDRTGKVRHAANAHITPGTIQQRNALVGSSPATASSRAASTALPSWARRLARHGLQLPHEASNALLVAGRHTRSGHPIAAMGPQVGYYSPEIFDEYELHMPGIQESGVVFPGASPYVLIGHTKSFAWTGTTPEADNADTFAEKLCNPDGSRPSYQSTHYRYRGKCRAFTSRTIVEQTPIAPTSPSAPQTVTMRTLRSVHGPVGGFAKVGRQPVALTRASSVYHHGVRSILAFELLAENKVHSPREFVSAMRHFTGNENWFYVSRSHIAWFASGWFQRHASHTSLQLPAWGTGKYDWEGFQPSSYSYRRQPDSYNSFSIDPKQGYLASWNNKGARGMTASPGVWSWGQVQRVELLADPTRRAIRAGHKLTLADLVGISGNASTQDLRALKVLPSMLRVLGKPHGQRERHLVADLRRWWHSGVHRRATHGRTYDDHSAAIMTFDEWWIRMVHGIYDPKIGPALVAEISDKEDLVLRHPAVATGFFDGWHSQVLGVLHKVLGVRDPSNPRASYCGNGSLASCRKVLRGALTKAVAALVKAHGGDPAHWRKPVNCGGNGTCDENTITIGGALEIPNQPFENRGTFHQAVEIR